jgi:translocation and assembly module TamB
VRQEPLPPSNPNTQADSQPRRPRSKVFGRVGVSLALALTAGSLGTFWYARYFLNEKLSPWVQSELTKALKRPVNLGRVERVSFGSIRFGPSQIPATAQEANFLTAKYIDVQVEPWSYIQSRKLVLDVTIKNAEAYSRQDLATGLYFPKLEPPKQAKESDIDLKTVKIEDGRLTLQPIASGGGAVSLTQLQIQSDWKIVDPNNQSFRLSSNGKVVLPAIANSTLIPTPDQLNQAINAQKLDGGALTITVPSWDLTHGQGIVQVRSQNLIATSMQGFLAGIPFSPTQGRIDGTVNLKIRPGNNPVDLQGNVRVRDANIVVKGLPQPFTNVAGNVQFDGTTTTLQGVSGNYNSILARTDGTISAQSGLNLDVAVEPTDIAKALESFNVKPAVAIAGEVKLNAKLAGKSPRITGYFTATKPITIDKVVLNQVQGKVETKDLTTLQLSRIQAIPALGGKIQGEGQIRLPNNKASASALLAFNLQGLTAEKVASLYKAKLPVPVGLFTAAVQVYGNLDNLQVLTQFDAPNARYPATGEVVLAGNVAKVRNTTVKFPIGAVGVEGDFDLAGKRAWQAQLNSSGIPLSAFAPNQRGSVSGLVNLNSSTGSFALNQIIAKANLNFPQGAGAIRDPITARLTWNGKDLAVPGLQVGNYLTARGKVDLDLDAEQMPTGIAGIDLDLRSRRVPINRLRSFLPQLAKVRSGDIDFNGKLAGALDRLNINGKLSVAGVKVSELSASLLPGLKTTLTSSPSGAIAFRGNVSGTANSPQLAGTINLSDLKVDRVAFAPNLSGPLSYGQQGLVVDLQGGRDRIAARLDSRFRPQDFEVKLNEATASGNRIGDSDRLSVAIKNFPVPLLAAFVGQTGLDGTISSQLTVDFGKNPTVVGSAIVDRPRFGRISAARLAADVSYSNGNATINNGKIDLGGDRSVSQGEYKFNLAYTPRQETQIQGKLEASQGQLQDVFATLQWFQFSDISQGLGSPNYATAAALQPLKVIGLGNSPLYQQLEYFSQIAARIEQQETATALKNNNLPPLTDVKGRFDGAISFSSSRRSGFKIGFDLIGKGFEYGKLAVDDIQAKGGFSNDVLSLSRVKLQSGDRFGQITNAMFSLRAQSGKIELVNFPIESLRPLPIFSNIPVDVTGNANGTATIGGGLLSPTVVGNLTLADATINRQPLESASGDFDYQKGRFKFKSIVRVAGPEPINVSGEVPYILCPFADSDPSSVLCKLAVNPSNSLSLNIDVKNEGLAFINILNQPVRWLSGKGSGSLVVSGTTRKPQVKGKVMLDEADFQVAGLPSDITAVKGEIDFGLDRLKSDLTGRFSDGNVSAKGILAIADPNLISEGKPDYENPLTVFAERLKLDLKDRYLGGANGFLVVRGSALAPELGGEVALSDGRVILGGDSTNGVSPPADSGINLGFNQLLVKLRQNVQISNQPLLNFVGEGNIEVNGSVANIRPSGRINILRGQLNAVTARFRLDRGYENYAEFLPDQGFNPRLNVRLLSSLPEVTRTPVATSPFDALNPRDIPVSNLGATRTLQIQATVVGFANNLRPEDIELRSSPPRTQTEILALIGGGLLQQGGGDPTAAIANLAGGTLIGFLQDAIGDALNLSEFNLSPTTSSPVGGRASSLGFAAEAAIDISRSFSVSVRSVINDPAQPTTYTVRYRLNPNTLFRANTDAKGNNSGSVEFEARF